MTNAKTHAPVAAASREHALRAHLESPWRERPIWMWIAAPLLFIVAFCIAAEAKRRRRRALERGWGTQVPPDLPGPIFTVGNVLVGGTGKSPLVRACARAWLENGHTVVVLSRGHGAETKEPVQSHLGNLSTTWRHLNDENREHWLLLRHHPDAARFHVWQGSRRGELVARWHPQHPAIFLHEDGLQHFGCPSSATVCLWSAQVLLRAPRWPLPVGPYREGTPRKFTDLLSGFGKRLWVEDGPWAGDVSHGDTSDEHGDEERWRGIARALNQCGLAADDVRDMLLDVRSHLVRLVPREGGDAQSFLEAWSIGENIEGEALERLAREIAAGRPALVTGIARPERVKRSLLTLLSTGGTAIPSVAWLEAQVADHGALDALAESVLAQGTHLFLTAKDVCRWASHSGFLALARKKRVYICLVEAVVKTYAGETKPPTSIFENQI